MSLERHLATHLQQLFVDARDYQMYLCDWTGTVKDQPLKSALTAQVQDINIEMENLRRCLDLLGAPVMEDVISPIVRAYRERDRSAMEMMRQASSVDLDTHFAMTDVSFASAMLGSYQGILVMARALHRKDIVSLLEQTIQRQEDDLQRVQGLLADLVELSIEQRAA